MATQTLVLVDHYTPTTHPLYTHLTPTLYLISQSIIV